MQHSSTHKLRARLLRRPMLTTCTTGAIPLQPAMQAPRTLVAVVLQLPMGTAAQCAIPLYLAVATTPTIGAVPTQNSVSTTGPTWSALRAIVSDPSVLASGAPQAAVLHDAMWARPAQKTVFSHLAMWAADALNAASSRPSMWAAAAQHTLEPSLPMGASAAQTAILPQLAMWAATAQGTMPLDFAMLATPALDTFRSQGAMTAQYPGRRRSFFKMRERYPGFVGNCLLSQCLKALLVFSGCFRCR
mmetsp:Transcript_102628/g.260671  ORF Transcript_102628/g.260671 Transcript_102628/m.260671 type:complete len:246 (-) Transcript_102628:1021-1758(-)